MSRLFRFCCIGATAFIFMFPVSGTSREFDPVSAVNNLYSNMDPFSTRDNVSTSPARDMIANMAEEQPCHFARLGSPLSLLEAVERALCNNPQTSQTWASVKEQAAQVGTSQAAYLPTLNATVEGQYATNKTEVKQFSQDFNRDNDIVEFNYNLGLV